MTDQSESDSKRNISLFTTPDSGIDCSTSHLTGFTSQDSIEARTSYNYSSEDKQTPKPRKRRRRDVKHLLMSSAEQLTSTPYFEGSAQLQFGTQFDTSRASHSAEFANESSTSVHYDSGVGSSFNTDADQSASSLITPKEEHATGEGLTGAALTQGLQNDVLGDDDEEDLEAEKENDRVTGRRRRRTKIVRPNEEEFNERVAAKLVGRLVIKQKKDAESSKKIMSVLKELGYELKKGRRMNRNVTRFSAFVEEEAMETGRDLERINKAYTPTEAVNSVFIQNQKSYCQLGVLMNKLQSVRTFYSAAKKILESDQTPLAFHRAPPNAVVLNPALQERLGHLTWITHGFSLTAYSGLVNFLMDMTESALHHGFKEMVAFDCNNVARTEMTGSSLLPVSSLMKSESNSVTAGQWPTLENSASAGSSYNESCRMASQASFATESSSCRQFGTSINGLSNAYSGRIEEQCSFFPGYSEPERFNVAYRTPDGSSGARNDQYYQSAPCSSNTNRDGYGVPYPFISGYSGSERFIVPYQTGNTAASATNSFGCYRPQRLPHQCPGYY